MSYAMAGICSRCHEYAPELWSGMHADEVLCEMCYDAAVWRTMACTVCGEQATMADDEGTCYCDEHAPRR